MSDIDLSIIVASYNTRALLRRCLESIYSNTGGIEYEVIVVDDCSADGSSEVVREAFPQAILMCNAENMRYARTNNVGLRAARGRYGLLLNSDTEVRPGAFRALVEFMDAHPEVAAAGPKLVNPDGSVQHCVRGFPGVVPMFFQALGLHKIWRNNPVTSRYYNTTFDYSRAQSVPSIGTTSFIIRRSTWEKYGLLDERLSLAFVDLAYCRMLGEQQQMIYYVPNAVVLHYGSQSINQNGRNEIERLHRELRLFYDLYFARGHNPALRFLVHLGIGVRKRIELLEYALSRDKRVLGGPPVPPAQQRRQK